MASDAANEPVEPGVAEQLRASPAESGPTLGFRVVVGWCWLLTGLSLGGLVKLSAGFQATQPPRPVTARFMVDINAAAPAELQALPEVGPALATRIVEYRQTHGPFQEYDELLRVRGLGRRTLEQLQPLLRIGSAEARAALAGVPQGVQPRER